MIIPYNQLSPEALRGLIEDFVTREGTDYGEQDFSLTQKVQQVEAQIIRGDVVVVFDAATETVSLLSRHDAQTFLHNAT
jgi:uncharacterized protein